MDWFFGSYQAAAEPTAGQKKWEELQANEDNALAQRPAFASLLGESSQQDAYNPRGTQGVALPADPFLDGPGAPAAMGRSLSIVSEVPRPKRTGKGLQAWEVDDDIAEDPGGYGESNAESVSRWTPFLPRDETIMADQADSRIWVVEKDCDQAVEGGGALELACYEEQVLGMPAVTSKLKHVLIASSGAEVDTMQRPPEEGFSSSDDEVHHGGYDLRNPRDAAVHDGCTFLEVPHGGGWSVSDDATWSSGLDSGTLSGDGDSMTACYAEEQFDDFDVEAMIKVDRGDHAGLIFRHLAEGHFHALCLNFREKRVELRGPTDASILGSALLRRERWHQVRVRATGSSLMFFVDYRQVGQVAAWGVGDLVYARAHTKTECKVVRIHSDGSYVITPLRTSDERPKFPDNTFEKTVNPSAVDSVPGLVGIWAADSTVRVKGMVVTRLHEIIDDLRKHYERMEQERQELQHDSKMQQAGLLRRTKAAKLIQEMSKLTLGFNKMRMQVYKQAEEQGRDDLVREKKLLTWFALLSVFARINQEMAKPAKMEQRNRQYLEMLDRYHPPPPPPPLRDPPMAADEELHYRYEERRQKYVQQWEKAGKMIYGQEKFDSKIRKMEGPAQRQKRLIAERCFGKSGEVMSEQEHQEYLQKAWRLENDWAVLDDDAAKAEFERWREEKMGHHPTAKRKSTNKPQGRVRMTA